MTRDEKLASLRESLSVQEREMIAEVIETAEVKEVFFGNITYDLGEKTLAALAEEFRK